MFVVKSLEMFKIGIKVAREDKGIYFLLTEFYIVLQ